MENLKIYNALKTVPEEAKKTILSGRLKGFTDVNPMYRIKKMTEIFGVCGFGWKYVVTNKWMETSPNGEIKTFVDIDLFVKIKDEWSCAIPGTGGSSFFSNEKNGTYTSDECYKMALTDAISVACKALGVCADVYWDKDNTKYDIYVCSDCGKEITGTKNKDGEIWSAKRVAEYATNRFGKPICVDCQKNKASKNTDGR